MKFFGIGQARLFAPCEGSIKMLDELCDEVFSNQIMGPGVAIDPIDSRIYAPCDASVTSIADTMHAITLRNRDGIEVLIHVGINTVELKGVGFEVNCVEGSRVRRGELLAVVDIALVRSRGYDPCVIMVMPDNPSARVEITARGRVTKESAVITVRK